MFVYLFVLFILLLICHSSCLPLGRNFLFFLRIQLIAPLLVSISPPPPVLEIASCTPVHSPRGAEGSGGEGRGREGRCSNGVPPVCEGSIMHYLIFTPRTSSAGQCYCAIYLIGKVSSEWFSDLFKVKHRKLYRGGDSESERRLPVLPHAGPSQGLSLWGLSEG